MSNFIKEMSLIDVLDSVLLADNAAIYGGVRDKSPLRPSSSGFCGRKLAYQFHEYKNGEEAVNEEKAPNVIRLLSVGHYIESSIINHFRQIKKHLDIYVKYKDQIVTVAKMDDGTLIQGEVDFAIEGPDFKMLCDAKTTKIKHSSWREDSWSEMLLKWDQMDCLEKISDTCYYAEDATALVDYLGDDYKCNNIYQLNMYLGSHFFQERGYEYASLIYYLKNDSRMYELRFKFSEELQRRVIDKYKAVHNSEDPFEVTPCFSLGSIRCSFCPYKEKCYSEEDPKYAYFQTLPKKYWSKRIEKVEFKDELVPLFEKLGKCLTESEKYDKIEKDIVKLMWDNKLYKVKLEDGNVWQVRELKSGLVLRRGKD